MEFLVQFCRAEPPLTKKKFGLDAKCTKAMVTNDEYANRLPNPKHMPKYTKVKVLHTQDKHASAEQSSAATAAAL